MQYTQVSSFNSCKWRHISFIREGLWLFNSGFFLYSACASSFISELCFFSTTVFTTALSMSKSIKSVIFFNINNDSCSPSACISMKCLFINSWNLRVKISTCRSFSISFRQVKTLSLVSFRCCTPLMALIVK